MKRTIKILISAVLFSVMLLSFTACANSIKADVVKADTESFFAAIKAEDYETAKTYLHPERPVELKTYFERIEKSEGVDFSTAEIIKFTGVSVYFYDSDVGGSYCEFDVDLSVSGIILEAEVKFVKNDGGYGLYDLDFDEED